ncbi:transcriptional regulator, LacI family [Clostridium cavendishii DSM 21758]|uniref:Transcriptional regulator, LacI family n=1 Tax=Clostridium cavendishii DSM 21758 TaxID=1121302 RepID=A0A1M6CXJ2_9CLOT|nr:LacI family DNA-binding transcriptional regulator [Clostridium cavendishii]SHI65707.1 transcriptional regulator, LacI family [Clostridium cavendishii DSM 21758]
MSVTIREVAKEAGVSPSTVSRVIANNPKISDETKERVLEVIKRLDYHPNAIARSLAKSFTSTIGIVLPREAEDLFKNPFFVQAMTGINVYAQKKGYYIMYSFTKTEEEEVELINRFISSNIVDGVILLIARSKDKCIKLLKEKEFPFTVVGRPDETEGVLWVDNDNFQAAYNATNYLFARGYNNLAFIGGTGEWNVSKDRLNGYIQAHTINGMTIDDNMIVQMEDFKEKYGYEAINKILEYKKPDAVLATDDLLAFGVLKALQDNNTDDIKVLGFNNTPLAEYQVPPLTSIDINAEKLGYYAAKLLIGKLKDENMKKKHYIIETNLVERMSTIK